MRRECDPGALFPYTDKTKRRGRATAHVTAEGAEGLAVEGVAKPCFGEREAERQRLADCGRHVPSARGLATPGEHHDHQRPQAQRDTDESWQITDEPHGWRVLRFLGVKNGRIFTRRSGAGVSPGFEHRFFPKPGAGKCPGHGAGRRVGLTMGGHSLRGFP